MPAQLDMRTSPQRRSVCFLMPGPFGDAMIVVRREVTASREATASVVRKTIRLGPGQDTVVVQAPVAADPNQILVSLEISAPSPVLVVCGELGPLEGRERASANALVGQAVVAAARRTNAIVLDGGINAGVYALVGAAHAEDPRRLRALVGVAPAGLVQQRGVAADSGDGAGPTPPGTATLEPYHTHVVLVDTDQWGGETRLLFALAEALAKESPVAVLLAGGEPALAEAVAAVGHGWPLFVLTAAGGAAGRLAAPMRRGGIKDQSPRPTLSSGRVTPISGADAPELTRRLTWALDADVVLQDAWKLFATYDRAAKRLRRAFVRFQTAILLLGVLTTLLALLHQQLGTQALRWVVIAASIIVGALIALAGRRATGKRWVVTRAAAESVKSEIFRYRTRTGKYADTCLPGGDRVRSRPEKLAARLETIQTRLMHSEASSGALQPYDGPLPPPMYPDGAS